MTTTPANTTLLRLSDTDLTVSNQDEDIRGKKVVDMSGDDLGEVSDLLVDEGSVKVRFMEVASGGFLGIGQSKVIIPVDAITRISEDEVRIAKEREVVASSPRYDPDLVPENYWHDVYSYYGYSPYWMGGYVYPSFPYYANPLPSDDAADGSVPTRDRSLTD
jgi:sporulation protein YlmC with PRC-barrel domain